MPAKATVFEFSSYAWDPAKRQAIFHYKTILADLPAQAGKTIDWAETIIFPHAPDKKIPKELTAKLLESLHIILGISYYKYHCPKTVKIPYQLTKEEANFWNVVYKKGLGEFFYKNNLDPKISPKFLAKATSNPGPVTRNLPVTGYPLLVTKKALVGIGGGKDSIVSAELLKQAGFDITAFHIETQKPSELVNNVIKTLGAKSLPRQKRGGISVRSAPLKIQRFLDPKVYEEHPYNGHIPISAVYAFLGLTEAIFGGYRHFIVSNEHSSNFGNLTYRGLVINHQWSKSFEFEVLMQNYIKNSISKDVNYFSLLRPFYEIRIAKLFTNYPQYFPLFSSCNRNFTAMGNQGKLWCCNCAKCVFVWTMLSASLPKKELVEIFGKDLSAEEKLQPLFNDISGQGSMKPFDCVGTFEEVQEALRQAQGKPSKYPEVWQTQKENAVPEQFRFLGMENALILGYGKEGKVTEQYLKKQYPKLKIGVGDESQDKEYLKKQKTFDIAIKTPGINKSLVEIPYTTATNIFFSEVKGKNTIIGVTGSKGKSTTASLVYHILKVAGKDVQLLGNIGTPMLETLLRPVPKDRIFVLELSSYQLDDIKFSPDIAVVTNLFPEHMDFHGSLKNYYEAKKNIIKTADYFVHNEKTKHWLKDYAGKAIKFSPPNYQSNLLGEHNQSNIGAAVAVAELLKISQANIKKAVKTFTGLPHRLENVGTFSARGGSASGGKKITFYDDAISTTPDSTIMAIKALKNIDTIFLGGQDRGYTFTELEKTIKKYKIKNVVLFPDSGKKILRSRKGFNVLETSSMQEAVKFAYENTAPGKICLLSCASPSYSLWKNFEEKGDQFKFFVKKFANSKP